MVDYTISSISRFRIYFYAALMSFLIVSFINFGNFNIIGIDVRAPSAFIIYIFIFEIYDKYLWNKRPFKWLHDIPDLNREYTVTVIQADSGKTNQFSGFIKQTFTKIQVQIERSKSISRVTTASLDLSTPGSEVLKFSYRHEPRVADLNGHNQGDGFQTLFITQENMQGTCFSTWCRSATVIFSKI